MKNNFSIKIYFFFILILSFSYSLSAQNRPNILWITCEDISPTLSFYGDNTADTPMLDKLASESLIYTNAFATVGVCAPARSSIITGMYPISIGTQNMRTGKDYFSWGLREYSEPSGARDIEGNDVPLYSAVTPPEVKCFTEYLRASGYYCTNNAKTDYQFAAPVSAWDANGNQAHWKNRGKDQPFFAVFNLGVTHESRIWVNKDKPLTVDPRTVPLPPYFPDDPVIRQDVARNYANIELMDAQVAELISEIEEAGLLENTIIFFYSDHGGPLPRGKREHYDSGLKVPLLVRFPNGKNTGRVNELISFVDLAPTVLSLAGHPIPEHLQGSAFLGHQKSDVERDYVYGSGDRFDEFPDRIRTVRDKNYLYVRNFHPELPRYKDVSYRKNMDMMNTLLALNEEGVLSGPTARWFETSKPSEELYDVYTDPFNMKNLANDPGHADKLNEMRNALEDWLVLVGDKGKESELALLNEMWPGGVQPTTDVPIVVDMGKKIVVSSTTEGASLVYLIADNELQPDLDSGWKLYQDPIKVNKGQYAYFMAVRIGFKDSQVITFSK